MARNSRHVVGIDIGTSKILTVVGTLRENGELEITGIGKIEAVGVRRGIIANLDEVEECLRSSISEAELMSGCRWRSHR